MSWSGHLYQCFMPTPPTLPCRSPVRANPSSNSTKPCWPLKCTLQDAEALQAQQRQLQDALAAAQGEAAALASQLQAARALAPQVCAAACLFWQLLRGFADSAVGLFLKRLWPTAR